RRAFAMFARRRRRHGIRARYFRFEARPFVDATRAFHEQRFDAHAREQSILRDLCTLFELEVAFAPCHHFVDGFFHLEAKLLLQLFFADAAHLEQNFREPARWIATLLLQRRIELALRQLARTNQHLTETSSRPTTHSE